MSVYSRVLVKYKGSDFKITEFLLKEVEITCDASRPFLLYVRSYLKVYRIAVLKLVLTLETC